MTKGEPPAVKGGILRVQDKPGLGLDIDDGFLRAHMAKGETWWG